MCDPLGSIYNNCEAAEKCERGCTPSAAPAPHPPQDRATSLPASYMGFPLPIGVCGVTRSLCEVIIVTRPVLVIVIYMLCLVHINHSFHAKNLARISLHSRGLREQKWKTKEEGLHI